ncbi:hypothetical protein OS493_025323 [Desmophyllum pertusum]|uniref:Uncharacterized protein n=1 Tax=Desmophyllum pertusum TaxID=174260 RepID=A0A9W9ZAH7_9CNID|nr:hypothetical protein OS493_025323 [Desmophyllum pertusum]
MHLGHFLLKECYVINLERGRKCVTFQDWLNATTKQKLVSVDYSGHIEKVFPFKNNVTSTIRQMILKRAVTLELFNTPINRASEEL